MLGEKGDFSILGGHGPFAPPKSAYDKHWKMILMLSFSYAQAYITNK